MPPPYCYEYPRPAVTVDLVVFSWDGQELRSLFIRRKKDPFAGRWAIPGGFMEIDEPLEAAARRELCEETGLEAPGPVEMIGVFGAPGRDPRGRTISVAFAAALRGPAASVQGGDDASDAAWLDPQLPLELAFDHSMILATALAWLQREVVIGPDALRLLGAEFDDPQVKRLHHAVGLPARSAIAWRARMRREGRIASQGKKGVLFRTNTMTADPQTS